MAGTIYDWSKNPSQNQATKDGQNWYEGMAAADVNNSARQLLASLRQYAGEATYAHKCVIGATNIQITTDLAYNKYVDGTIFRWTMPPRNEDSAGQPMPPVPKNPLLCVNNIPALERGNNGDGLPIMAVIFDPQTGETSLQPVSPESFGPGLPVEAVYCAGLEPWSLSAWAAERRSTAHLRGDTHGLLKADAEWDKYKTGLGCFIITGGAGAAASAAKSVMQKVFNSAMVGNIAMFPQTPPDGWLLCDGKAYPKADYPLLDAYLNNRYGGDNETFKLPDMLTLFPRMADGDTEEASCRLGTKQDDLIKAGKITGKTDDAGDDSTVKIYEMSVLQPGNADGGDANRGVRGSSWGTKANFAGAPESGKPPLPKHNHSLTLNTDGQEGFGTETRPKAFCLNFAIFAGFYDTATNIKDEISDKINTIESRIEARIEKIPRGKDGKDGEAGAPGAPGKDGTITGISVVE